MQMTNTVAKSENELAKIGLDVQKIAVDLQSAQNAIKSAEIDGISLTNALDEIIVKARELAFVIYPVPKMQK